MDELYLDLIDFTSSDLERPRWDLLDLTLSDPELLLRLRVLRGLLLLSTVILLSLPFPLPVEISNYLTKSSLATTLEASRMCKSVSPLVQISSFLSSPLILVFTARLATRRLNLNWYLGSVVPPTLLRLIPHLAEDEEVLIEQSVPLLGPQVAKQNLRLRFILRDDIKGFLMNQKLNYCFKRKSMNFPGKWEIQEVEGCGGDQQCLLGAENHWQTW